MNKKIVIPITILALVLIVAVIKMVSGGSKVELEWTAVQTEANAPSPISLYVYMENSGSMDGYMCAGSNLKDAVFDYVSDLQKQSSTCSLFYINTQVIPRGGVLENYIQNLTPSAFAQAGGNRQNTDLRQILETIMQRHERNAVSIFVSDCILDITGNARDYFGNCQVSVKNIFNEAFAKDKNLGVQIMRLQSKFDGVWYCGTNNEKLRNVRRPYYIWVIGNKYILAQINKKVPYIHILGGVDNYCAFAPSSGDIPFDIERKTYVVNHTKKIKVRILADLTGCLQGEAILQDPNNYVSDNPQAKVVSVNRVTSPNSKYSHLMEVEITNPKTVKQVSLLLSYPMLAGWVAKANDDSGTNIKENMDKTTGLLYLVRGVAEAYKDQNPYGSVTFKLKNK